MIISKEYETKWLDKKGKTTELVNMDDQHLITVVIHIDKLVRGAWQYDKPAEPIAHNAPEFVLDGFGQAHHNLCPPFYWNAVNELRARGLY